MNKKMNIKENTILKNSVVISIIMLLVFGLSFVVLQNSTITSSIAQRKSEIEYEYGEVLKSQAKLESSKIALTSLEESNDIELVATLITDNQEYCKLYKNPVITISVPENVTILEMGEVSLLGERQLQISSAMLEGNKIRIAMAGEQTTYKAENLNAQIKIPAKVSVNKLINNSASEITMTIENQNDTEARIYKTPINVSSFEGIIAYAKLENFNNEQNVLECYNNVAENVGNLDMDTTAKTATITGKILNNFDKDLTNVKLTFAPKWIHANGTEENATVVSDNFTNNELLIENFAIGQVVEFTAQITIPADLYYNEKLDLGFNAKYIYEEAEQTTSMNITLQTEQKAGVGTIEKMFTSEAGSLRVETLAQVGDDVIINNDNVKEGSTIRYTITATNLTSTTMNDVKFKMTRENDNTKFYDLKLYDTDILGENIYTYEELEDTSLEKIIGTLEPRQIKIVIFDVVVGNDTANKVVANKIDAFIGENSQQTSTIKDNIVESNVKLNLTSDLVKTLGDNSITIDDESLQLTYNLEISNLKGEKLNGDSTIVMELPSYVEEASVSQNDEEIASIYQEGKLITNIGNIEKGVKLIKVNLLIKKLSTQQEDLDLSYNLTNGEETYTSNTTEQVINYHDVNMDVLISSNVPENTQVKLGDTIEYTIGIENKGSEVEEVNVFDNLPSALQIQKVMINGVETTEYQITECNEFDCNIQVAPNTQTIVKIIAMVDGETDISNEIGVMAQNRMIANQMLKNTIHIEDDFENEHSLIEGDISDDNSEIEIVGNTIKGRVWLDEDKNGNRTSNEKMLSGIKVRLINADNKNEFVKDSQGKVLSVMTNELGEYEFKNIEQGNYFVLFEYDTDKYDLTKYQKEAVDASSNSDAEDYISAIEGKEKRYAITKNIEVDGIVLNIDMGLVNAPKFDLSVNQFISKVTVKNKQGTTNYDFNGKNTVKVEIPGKYMDGSLVIAEYTIRITNNGDIAGYVTNLADYVPADMKFNAESNKEWFVAEDGTLHNVSLANIAIEPGKSTEVTLVLTKTMTKDNTGTSSNSVEILSYTNTKEKLDMNLENNKGMANLIVSVKTGEIIVIAMVILGSIAILAGGIYVIKKKVIN